MGADTRPALDGLIGTWHSVNEALPCVTLDFTAAGGMLVRVHQIFCDSPITEAFAFTILGVACVSDSAGEDDTGAAGNSTVALVARYSLYKVIAHDIDTPSILECLLFNRTREGILTFFGGGYYSCPRFTAQRRIEGVQDTGSYKISTGSVAAVQDVAHSCSSVVAAPGPATANPLPAAESAVPFVEDFSGGLQPGLWDADATTADRFFYRRRNDSATPGDEEAVVGVLAMQAYLQTPPMVVVAAAAAGGVAVLRLDKLVLPIYVGMNPLQVFGVPLLNVVYSTDNGRNWASLFRFRYNEWTQDAWTWASSCAANNEQCQRATAGSVKTALKLQGGIDIVTLRIEVLCEAGKRDSTFRTKDAFVMDGLSLSGVTYIGTTDAEPGDDFLVAYEPAYSDENYVFAALGSTGFEQGFDSLLWLAPQSWTTSGDVWGGNVRPFRGGRVAVAGEELWSGGDIELYSSFLFASPGASVSAYITLAELGRPGLDCLGTAEDGRP
ncbi:hypothetical protein HYH03_002653 [Edaphochlamys debaryana]|uniref:Uncharacterized protein n=1 Tax=Edaphochlamys debaryana TaxID=47281 RepID=A0A836C5D2_9CHLO|nr:hypothetical protein HYH03_002653 [Edaphochlamys debaryana]|eukprot:KAG2499719.1 hypothetical protein HYH03_002653 [Edaphochlamys debaryana]